jgi:hypothetical protein
MPCRQNRPQHACLRRLSRSGHGRMRKAGRKIQPPRQTDRPYRQSKSYSNKSWELQPEKRLLDLVTRLPG